MKNELILEGRLAAKLPVESGEGRNGRWEKRSFVMELPSNYPTSVCIQLWGERIAQLDHFNEGDEVRAYVDIASREFNGKWYTDVKAWKIESASLSDARGASAGVLPPTAIPAIDEMPPLDEGYASDLPF